MPRKTKDWIESYLEYTANTEPPQLYHEWVAVSTLAAVLKRKCYLPWGPHLTFYPNLYIVLVGRSGKCKKGTAMGVGAAFLKHAGVKLAAEAITREALIRELNEASDTQIDVETGKMDFHASLTVYSQELTVFLGYNNLQLMSDLTDWYDCRDRWTYRTKNVGTDEIVGVWVNLIGATTPDLIQTALPRDAIGGGLASRIIFVYEENKQKPVPFPFGDERTVALGENLQTDLADIAMLRGEFRVTRDFLSAWGKWYMAQEYDPPFKHNPNFEGYVNRRPNHILKLCVILSASSRDDKVIDSDTLARAIDLLERTEKKMGRTFSGYGSGARAEVTSRVMDFVAKERETTASALLRVFYSDVTNMEELNEIVSTLARIGFLKQTQKGDGSVIIRFNEDFNNGEYSQPSGEQIATLMELSAPLPNRTIGRDRS